MRKQISKNVKRGSVYMKKFLTVMLAAIVACSIFTACSQPVEEEPSVQPTVIEAATPAPAETPAPEASADPTEISPTTGLPGNTVYKPIMVQIDNADAARPQTGLSYADIVYETDVDGGDTRFTALYNDAVNGTDAPDELIVGPVRSSRYYHQWIQEEWDALYVHMGGPDTTTDDETDIWGSSSEHIRQRINGAGRHAVNHDLFFPLKDGYSESDYAGIDLMEALAIYDYEPQALQSFAFYPAQDYADQPEIQEIGLHFFGDREFASYEYDADADSLLRFTRGKEHRDDATGEQITVQNAVIQFVHDARANDGPGSDRRIVDVKGSGDALFVIHGKLIKGTWERPTYDSPTSYTLESGEELTLAPGNTWITMMPSGREVTVTYADGTDETIVGEAD